MLHGALRTSSILVAVALAAPVTACSTTPKGATGSTDAGSTGTGGAGGIAAEGPCDPLEPKAIALDQVVGVGKDAAGTLYVDSSSGIFVSGGGKLIRQAVIGSGQSGNNEYNFSFVAPGADYSTAQNLLVETTGDTADGMALGGDAKSFLDQSPAGVTMLTLVGAATLSGMALVNTPTEIAYVADVANGDVLLATLPMSGDSTSSSGGLAIFYGPTSAVAQRTITSFQESMSNNGSVTFLVDGTPYVLTFGLVPSPDAGPFGAFALGDLTPQGGSPIGVTLRSPTPSTLPQGLSFTCLP